MQWEICPKTLLALCWMMMTMMMLRVVQFWFCSPLFSPDGGSTTSASPVHRSTSSLRISGCPRGMWVSRVFVCVHWECDCLCVWESKVTKVLLPLTSLYSLFLRGGGSVKGCSSSTAPSHPPQTSLSLRTHRYTHTQAQRSEPGNLWPPDKQPNTVTDFPQCSRSETTTTL